MFRNVFAFVVVASALALTGCSKCSEQPAAEAPMEAPAEAPADAAPAADASMEAAPAADATMEAAPAATPAQ